MGQAQGSIVFTFLLIVFIAFPAPTPPNRHHTHTTRHTCSRRDSNERLSGQIVGHEIEIEKLGIVAIECVGLTMRPLAN